MVFAVLPICPDCWVHLSYKEPTTCCIRFLCLCFLQVTQAVANARQMAANRERMGGPEGACAKRSVSRSQITLATNLR